MSVLTWLSGLGHPDRTRTKSDARWESVLGYSPRNTLLYEQALTHRSAGKKSSNERLEYLGDAVLNLVVADTLYRLYPDAGEGFLTRARAKVVCREHLNHVCHRIGLDAFLSVGSPIKSNAENIYGNAYEALVGAAYLEGGYALAETFVRRSLMNKESILRHLVEKETDFKSRLLEWGQTHRCKIEFRLLTERYDSKADRHTFIYEVLLNGKAIAQAAGTSKMGAQQHAAKKAWNIAVRKNGENRH